MSDPSNNSGVPEIPVFPYYIDEEMTTSFLATIEGGYTTSEIVSQSSGSSRKNIREGAAEIAASLPFVAKGTGSGSLAHSSGSSSEQQWQWERQHTMISQFNILRTLLVQNGLVKNIDIDPEESLLIGDIIEFEGSIRNNPLVELKSMMDTYLIFDDLLGDNGGHTQTRSSARSSSKQSNRPTINNKQILNPQMDTANKILSMGADSFEDAGLLDIHVSIAHQVFLDAVLTLRTDQRATQSIAYSSGSKCTVIGKVTGIIGEDETIKMYRRSGLRIFPVNKMQELMQGFASLSELDIDLDEMAINGPAIQVLPLGIFV